MIVDPEVFIIGGGIAASGKFLLDKIIESYQKNARYKTIYTPIVLASLGNKAGAFGAAHLVKDRL
jgi:glucokinase